MDSLFLLAGLLGAGDILLAWYLWQERQRRQKAESTANRFIRDNYRLIDALERKAGIRPPASPVVVQMPMKPKAIREARAELQARQAAQTGGVV